MSLKRRMFDIEIAEPHPDAGEYTVIATDEKNAIDLLGEVLYENPDTFHNPEDRAAVALRELAQDESFTVVYADLDRPTDVPPSAEVEADYWDGEICGWFVIAPVSAWCAHVALGTFLGGLDEQ